MKSPSAFLFAASLLFLACACPSLLCAQQGRASGVTTTKKTDPNAEKNWTLWRKGFDSFDSGESEFLAGNYEKALVFFKDALNSFQTLKRDNPNWYTDVVNLRIQLSEKKITSTQARLDEEKKKRPASDDSKKAPSVSESDPDAIKKIEALKKELATLKSTEAALRIEWIKAKTSAEQVPSLIAESDKLAKQLASLKLEIQELKKARTPIDPNADLEKTVASEKSRADVAMKQLSTQIAVNSELSASINLANAKIVSLDKQLQQFRADAATKKRADNLLVELREQMERQATEAADQRKKAENSLKIANDRLAEKSRDLEKSLAELKELRAKQNLDDTTRKIEAESSLLRSQNDRIKNELETTKSAHNALLAKLETAADKELQQNTFIKSMDAKIKVLNEENDKLKTAAQDSTKNIASVKNDLAKALDNEEKLKKQLADFAEKINKTPVDPTNTKILLEKATADLETAKLSLRDLSETKAKLQAELDTLKKTTEADTAKLSAASEEKLKLALDDKAKLQAELDTLKKTTEAATAKQSAESGEKLKLALDDKAKLQADLDTLKNTVSELKKQLLERENQKKSAESKAKELNDQFLKADEELQAIRQKAKIESAPATTSEDNSKIASLEKQLTELKILQTETSANLRTLQDEKNKLGESCIRLEKELFSAKAELEKAKIGSEYVETIEKLRKQLSDAESSITSLKKTENAQKIQLDALKANEVDFEQKAKSRADELRKADARIQYLEIELKKWQGGAESIVKEKLAKKDEALDELMKEHSSVVRQSDALKADLTDLNTKLTRYRKFMASARDTAEKAIEENRKLRAEIDMLRRDAVPGTSARTKPIPETKPIPQEVHFAIAEDPAIDSRTGVVEPDLKAYQDHMNAAKKLEQEKKFDDAMWEYLLAADAGVSKWEPHLALAYLSERNGDKDAALKSYEKALKLGAKRDEAFEKRVRPVDR